MNGVAWPPLVCAAPPAAWARTLIGASPGSPGRQASAKRCQAQPRREVRSARLKQAPPSVLTSTAATPQNDQAQPQISTASPAATAASGAGATMINSGAIAQTGRCGGSPAATSMVLAPSL